MKHVDGMFGPRTMFALQVFYMSDKEVRAAAREQHGLKLDAEAKVKRLKRKLKQARKKLKKGLREG